MLGVSSAALTRQPRRQRDPRFEAGGGRGGLQSPSPSKSMEKKKGEEEAAV